MKRMHLLLGGLLLMALTAGANALAQEANLLTNGDFKAAEEGKPAGWRLIDAQEVSIDARAEHPAGLPALRVDIRQDKGKNLGQVLQVVTVKPNTSYRLDADIKGTKAGTGLVQVKLLEGKSEGKRLASPWNGKAVKWDTVSLSFATEAKTTSVQVLCRFRQHDAYVGKSVWFAHLRLTEQAAGEGKVPAAVTPAAQASVRTAPPIEAFAAVPTFHSVGLYWSTPGQGQDVPAQVEYRAKGADWRKALDLWYDGRALGGRPAEYRGSIVHLSPGTEYEVKLTLGTGKSVSHRFTTWSETFPIARTVTLPATSSETLEIRNVHGSPQSYVLYAPAPGAAARIDVANAADCNVLVTNSSYVILRGLTLSGAKKHGIQLGGTDSDDVHDIVIEQNDISNWGSADATGFGENMRSAIYSSSRKLHRIVIQQNRLHDPRSNANCWKEKHKTFHPEGPQGVSFMRGQGQYVIRYNEITGNPTHHFNDSMGATHNFSYDGFPNRDSDIYGNYVAYVWDDGLEIEGADMNVRVWGNFLTETYHPLACAAVSLGPLYFFRNVACISRTGPKHTYGQSFLKAGGYRSKNGYFGDGRVYLLNNTVLVLPDGKGSGPQIKGAIGDSGERTIRNYVTRNNIFASAEPEKATAIRDTFKSDTNSFDYDLYQGRLDTTAGAESHGIAGSPIYVEGAGFDPETMTGNFALSPRSLGYDKGQVLPNFTDEFGGSAPDMGAQEAGTPPLRFGVKARQ